MFSIKKLFGRSGAEPDYQIRSYFMNLKLPAGVAQVPSTEEDYRKLDTRFEEIAKDVKELIDADERLKNGVMHVHYFKRGYVISFSCSGTVLELFNQKLSEKPYFDCNEDVTDCRVGGA